MFTSLGQAFTLRTLRRAPLIRLIAGAALALGAFSHERASAHDFWIVPAAYEPRSGELLAVRLCVGDHARADAVVRRDERIVRFVLSGTADDAAPATAVVGRDGGLPAGLVRLVHAGPQVLGYHSNRAWLELEPAKFEAYLREEGLDAVIAARAAAGTTGAPGHEVYSRCAKALLAVQGAEAAHAAPLGTPPDRALGFTLELVAESDPYTLAHKMQGAHEAPGGDIELAPFHVRLLLEGKPLAGALVKASLFIADIADVADLAAVADPAGSVGLAGSAAPAIPERVSVSATVPTAPVLPFGAPSGIGLHARTDAEGRVSFALPRPGTWLITSVHMLAAAPGTHPDVLPSAMTAAEMGTAPAATEAASALPVADWESLWASLSFEVPAP